MILHLGVIDQPYTPPPRRGRSKTRTVTTGDVAGWLETRYHVMEVFAQEHAADIASDIEQSLTGTIQSLLMGAPPSIDAFGAATSAIEQRFRQFIDTKEMERLGYPGVPTQAALMGVSHRFKRPYVRRPPRPSFQDTGLYETSFKAWVD